MNQNTDKPASTNLKTLIDRFINNEIKNKGRDKNKNTLKTYKTTLGHIQEFEAKEGYKVDFDTITLDFYYRYTSFLKNTQKLPTIQLGRI